MTGWLSQAYWDVEALLYDGGYVLQILFWVAAVLWFFICERLLFYFTRHDEHLAERDAIWEDTAEHHPREALWLRRMWLSEVRIRATRGLRLIRGLIAICPLLGLLGTITGMMELFQTLSVTGSTSARALSGGIAHATLPTLGGLLIALSGYYFVTYFEHRVRREHQTLREHLMLPDHAHPAHAHV